MQAASSSLGNLTPFDQNTLIKGLGAVQGLSLNQTQTNLQLQGAGYTLPSGSTNQPSFAAPSVTAPGGVSATDLLNEETQLSALITSLRLLMQGALTDQLEPGTSLPKPRMTLGFPISINVPVGYQYRNAVAEVEISVCPPEGTAGEAPSLITVLPQAKTYNVASLVTKSSQIGGGAVSGVLTLGGSFLHSRQTYYLVKDQDTIALQHAPNPSNRRCTYLVFDPEKGPHEESHSPVVFGWQFKPVLGQSVVQDGLRQTFAQLSFSPARSQGRDSDFEQSLSCEDDPVQIGLAWRHYDPKTGRVGAEFIKRPNPIFTHAPIYNSPPVPLDVLVDDNGDGTLTVRALGSFKSNTYVRVGCLVLGGPAGTPSCGSPANPAPGGAAPNASPGATPANNNSASNATTPAQPQPGAPSNTAPAPANGSAAPAATGNNSPSAPPAAASPAPGQTTFQIQGTVQIAATPPPQSSTNAATPAPTPNSFYATTKYIKFTAPANLIALQGAMLVNPDGFEAEIVRGEPVPPTVTCALRLAQYSTPPEIVSPKSANGIVGSEFSYDIKAVSYRLRPGLAPLTYSADFPVDLGLELDTHTGRIHGTPTQPWTRRVNLTATDNRGRTGTGLLTITITAAPPVITSGDSARVKVGDDFRYQITAGNSPLCFDAVGLPAGLSVDRISGWMSGKPTAPGTSNVVLTATNKYGSGVARLTIYVDPAPPVITSSSLATGAVNARFKYKIKATHDPTTYAAPDLPEEFTLNAQTGLISGTPKEKRNQTIKISATNSAGTGSADLTLRISGEGTPVIEPAALKIKEGHPFPSYRIRATHLPSNFAPPDLSKYGLHLDSKGVITGTPKKTEVVKVPLSARNAKGKGTSELTLTILARPVISVGRNPRGTVGSLFYYRIEATNSPTRYYARGLPPELWTDPVTGVISGKPRSVGTFLIELHACNGAGDDTALLTLTIAAPPDSSPRNTLDEQPPPPALFAQQMQAPALPLPGFEKQQLMLKSIAPPRPPAPSTEVRLVPFNDTLTQVTLTNVPILDASKDTIPPLPVVLIGTTAFGLRDHPFAAPPSQGSVTLFAQSSLLTQPGQQIVWEYLFEPAERNQRKVYAIPPQDLPLGTSRCSATVSSIAFLRSEGQNSYYAVRGQNLDHGDLKLLSPLAQPDAGSSSTLFLFHLDSKAAKTAQAAILQCGSDAPFSLPISAPPSSATTAAATTTVKAGPQVYTGDPNIMITGSNLDQVVSIWGNGLQLSFTPGSDNSSLIIDDPKVPTNITAKPIPVTLLFYLSDKTYVSLTLTVKKR